MVGRGPRLEGKVAIVTGAGSSGPGIGNGKATSVLFQVDPIIRTAVRLK